ncbi:MULTISPECIES: hypothetical protein [Nostocales]|uniref:Uncharacterized protein n=3 Tax=Nostocales TaxID=1161 RepID=A0A0C1QNT1_9CYAN|nr:hypothetical protein [Tolypothrix bouteillei]KAF3889415.1 hypothetical protein DA73_0400030980 [Tolypothrix bouteillei VB521301]
MGQFFFTVAPIITDKILELGNTLLISHFQQVCATKCAAIAKTSYAVGLVHGAGGMLLLIVVIGTAIVVIQQIQKSQTLPYAIA